MIGPPDTATPSSSKHSQPEAPEGRNRRIREVEADNATDYFIGKQFPLGPTPVASGGGFRYPIVKRINDAITSSGVLAGRYARCPAPHVPPGRYEGNVDPFSVDGSLLAFLLVLMNGVFVAAEFAFVKVRPTQVNALVEQGNPVRPSCRMPSEIWISHRLDDITPCYRDRRAGSPIDVPLPTSRILANARRSDLRMRDDELRLSRSISEPGERFSWGYTVCTNRISWLRIVRFVDGPVRI